jgi:hypothetical protein
MQAKVTIAAAAGAAGALAAFYIARRWNCFMPGSCLPPAQPPAGVVPSADDSLLLWKGVCSDFDAACACVGCWDVAVPAAGAPGYYAKPPHPNWKPGEQQPIP